MEVGVNPTRSRHCEKRTALSQVFFSIVYTQRGFEAKHSLVHLEVLMRHLRLIRAFFFAFKNYEVIPGGMDMFKSLKLVLLLSSAVLVTACGSNNEETESASVTSSEVSSVETAISVSFIFEEDGQEIKDLAKSFDVQEGQTVLEALKENYEVIEEGGLVSSIEGNEQVAKESKYWLYTVNDEQPTVGAADYVLEDGDEVKWGLNGY